MRHVRRGLLAAVLSALVLWVHPDVSSGAGLKPILQALQNGNAYVSPALIHAGKAGRGDVALLNAQASDASGKGVPEKFAILSTAPTGAAHSLRSYLNYSGVLILVDPGGIGISSGGALTQSEEQSVAQAVAGQCVTKGLVPCALLAGKQAVQTYQNKQAGNQRNAAKFWVIALIVFALIIAGLAFALVRRSRGLSRGVNDLRTAASNTLSIADEAVQRIEESAGSGRMNSTVRGRYDAALAQRDRARSEIESGKTPAVLTQANQDAAQAVLALQGVMRELGVQTDMTNPLEGLSEHRCFYCGRTDRPPYVRDHISDGKGNTLDIEVCAFDQQRLAQGRTPAVATVQYMGTPMPWWAVPNSPYFYAYGGPSWQYWLPFAIGMDVGGWYGGGWNDPMLYGAGPDWNSGWGGDSGTDSGAGATPGDSAGVDFGNWDNSGAGDQSGGWDTGGGGWDSGGTDGGGWDSGGGGWDGGGDSGGGDSGGWS